MYSLAELKEKKAWQFYLVYSDNSRLICQFPSDAAADQAFFLLKLMELNRLNSSRETRLDKKLESSFEIICVFPLEKKKKKRMHANEIFALLFLNSKFKMPYILCLIMSH